MSEWQSPTSSCMAPRHLHCLEGPCTEHDLGVLRLPVQALCHNLHVGTMTMVHSTPSSGFPLGIHKLEITMNALSGIADVGQIPADKPEYNKFTGP